MPVGGECPCGQWSRSQYSHLVILTSISLGSTQIVHCVTYDDENEIGKVRLDIKVLLEEMEDKLAEAPPRKKLKTVPLSDSDDESGLETEDIPISVTTTAVDEIDAYSNRHFDGQDREDGPPAPMLPLTFWKTQSARFQNRLTSSEVFTPYLLRKTKASEPPARLATSFD